MSDDIASLRRILASSRTIAVVGLSAEWHRPSYFAAKYMQEHGYRIVPVNPRYAEVLGERCHASLETIDVPIDIVDVFRRTEDVLPIAVQAIAIGAKCLWQQIGVKNVEAARLAEAAGLDAVMDRCVKIEHARLFGGLHWAGVNTGVISARRAGVGDRMADRVYRPETLAIHAGQIPDAATGARALPIYQTTSFVFDSADHAASLFNLQTFGNVYSRLSNPTVAALEERVAALEGGRAALASASGMAAEAIALLTLLSQGDHVVAAGALYGGTVSMLAVNLERLGIATTFVDAASPEAFAAAMRPNTRAVFAESIGNPSLSVLDIAAVAEVAHAHGVPLVVDNTVPSPFLCNPIRFGADIVVHSATKYLAGHGTTLGGVMVESGRFPWDNGKFPGMTEPSRGYHGVKFFETFGDFGFTMRARMETLRVYGAALAPMSAWQILQGVETLPLRMERHCANALAVAEFLQCAPSACAGSTIRVSQDHPQHALVTRQMRSVGGAAGASGLLAFGVEGGLAAGVKFIEAAQFMSHLANIGDTRTLVIHPASTTHRQLDEAQQLAAGVKPDMIRISVGIEHIDDILWDIDQALEAGVA